MTLRPLFYLEVRQVALELPLGAAEPLVLAAHVGQLLVGVAKVLLALLPRPEVTAVTAA